MILSFWGEGSASAKRRLPPFGGAPSASVVVGTRALEIRVSRLRTILLRSAPSPLVRVPVPAHKAGIGGEDGVEEGGGEAVSVR